MLPGTGAHPSDLWLELTESVSMGDIDYLGTGYSSLNYLRRFPFDGVKVDRSFVDGRGTDPHDSAFVTAILTMARPMVAGR